ncbi:site-specific integrase [Sphingomonas sp.]|uniref:tyrosine-type recombinase/integrase n=1 Tax=Sphingomonas sp. TaxID=28214 RepID=UPI0025D501BD|nr:site-specific integrase [Sphingomonas sp.]
MGFILDKEQVKPGLIIFRRGDVGHDQYYCRVRIQNVDRYKTISLRTSDRQTARDLAMDQDADIRFRVKHDVPVFNRPFSQVAEEYADAQQRRANAGEVSQGRAMNVKNKVNGPLNLYVGSSQIHLVSQERWSEYPLWRRENGVGRRAGIISDSTIRIEMSIFAAVMNYAVSKRYVPAHHRFEGMPKLKTNRRDEFTLEEYRKLHSAGRKWMKEATTAQGIWYRQMCYNFILIMCNTGMRPVEAKNMRWRDITTARDKDGSDILVIYVQGKGKMRKLIAPKSVGEYLDRVRAHSKATKPDDAVFTIINGKPAVWLYRDTVEELLKYANLRDGPSGIPRTTYCFRHTYATFRLSAGVDVYILAQQMGTSVKMIEQHYGHVNTIKHADRVLMGIGGWDAMHTEMDAEIDAEEATAKARQAVKSKQSVRPSRFKG